MSVKFRRLGASLQKSIASRRQAVKAFSESNQGKRWHRISGIVFTAGIIGYLVFRLHAIGWTAVITSLPGAPAFYLLVLGRFFVSPAFQTFIFSILWKRPPLGLFPVFLKKQVWDRDILDYSGQMYLFMWARKNLGIPTAHILHILKDNTILSSAASAILGSSLLLVFWSCGYLTVSEEWRAMAGRYLPWMIIGVPISIALYIKMKKSVLFLSSGLLWAAFLLHTLRLLVGQILILSQWAIAMPDVSIAKWFMMLAVWIMVNWVPLMPSKDLLFIGAGMQFSGVMNLSEPQTAGMLIAAGVLNKLINIVIMSGCLLYRDSREKTVPISQ